MNRSRNHRVMACLVLGLLAAGALGLARSAAALELRYADTVVPGSYQFNPDRMPDENEGYAFNIPAAALGQPSIYSYTDEADNSDILSLGDAGSIALGFNAPVLNTPTSAVNPYGYDLLVIGNAFNLWGSSTLRWSEPGFIEVAQKDANGNPATWHLILARKFTNTATAPVDRTPGSILSTEKGNTTALFDGMADVTPSDGEALDLFATTGLLSDLVLDHPATGVTEGIGGAGVDISRAVLQSAPGVPLLDSQGRVQFANLEHIDFIRITDAQSGDTQGGFNYISTEIDGVIVLPDTTSAAVARTWSAAGGMWAFTGAWTGGSHFPSGAGHAATFGAGVNGGNVNVNQPVTLGTLTIDQPASAYQFTGAGRLRLQTTSGNASLQVLRGSHQIQVPVQMLSPTTLHLAVGTSLTITGPVAINPGIAVGKTGTGQLTLQGAPQWSQGASFAVQAGHVLWHVTSGTTRVEPGASLLIAAGASARIDASGADPLHDALDSANRVDVVNDSTTNAGLTIAAGNVLAGAIGGLGQTTVEAGASLSVRRLRQSSLVIGGTAPAASPAVVTLPEPASALLWLAGAATLMRPRRRRSAVAAPAAIAARQRSGARGFTIIELLVVVAIIALLVGLMVPALAQAKGMARAANCGSNIRQLAIANVAYASGNNGHFVPGAANYMRNKDRWHGQRDRTRDAFDPKRGPLWSYLGGADEVKQCPEFGDFDKGFEAGCGGYGYNNQYVGRVARETRIDPVTRQDANSIQGAKSEWFLDPATAVMFADAAFLTGSVDRPIEYSFAEPPQFTTGPADPSIHFRHRAKANVAWVDGHVDAQVMSFTRPNVYGFTEEQNRSAGIGWFGPEDNSLFDRD